VADPEVDATMSRPRVSTLAVLVLLVVPTFLVGVGALAPAARAASSPPLTASITGPTVVSTGSTSVFQISGWGGPGVASNGSLQGAFRFFANPVGTNLTGVEITPPSANITHNASHIADLIVGNATETLSIDVMVSSTYQGKNDSTNLTYTVTVVQPYVVTAAIVNPTNSTVSAFTVYVTLDGNVVGSVNVSTLLAGGTYHLSYKYPTLGLSPGDHTFAISLAQEHGLVTFANGQTVYTQTVYVTGPAPNYTLWYVAGIVAFFGALFIFASRVAARRRGTTRR
jgi:CARDB